MVAFLENPSLKSDRFFIPSIFYSVRSHNQPFTTSIILLGECGNRKLCR
ncbi:hypothetical protein IQ230_20595 [Gloeocapsopsis crepidinum LEGE 06123]|uniref:Uncharacterized protein n=1 Tax=Gloeocapsopsis crepidinum LEGE 06123 TaxID=588587 RepID=A0ABR9UWL9_9CHRO|nr:hypothetical protein [Gloeocapsopsis crepidinum]MBE9192705.1 hypothetical protein [Gloeocapsopsis crepidinum LEGE 06123]